MFHYFTIKFHFSFFTSFRLFSLQIFCFASLELFLLRSETKLSKFQVCFFAIFHFFHFFSLFFAFVHIFSHFFSLFFALKFSLRFDLVILLRSEAKFKSIFRFFSLFFAFFAFFAFFSLFSLFCA